MNKSITFLTPIKVKTPPYHTQIIPQCFTCSHFPTCTTLRLDYLKTLKLMQDILGDPQQDLCLKKSNPVDYYPCYDGNPIKNADTLFPEVLTFTKRILPTGQILTESTVGTFESAIYQDFNTILFIYNAEGYKVMFKALYDEEAKEFKIHNGVELVYHIIYEFPEDSIFELQVNLESWRTEMLEKVDPELDLINTTYFSAQLNCHFFEPVKGLSPEDGLKRAFILFPDGIPCGDNEYYHIETIHVEPHKVPEYYPNNGKVGFVPMPYPIFIPTPCDTDKPCRRDDINE